MNCVALPSFYATLATFYGYEPPSQYIKGGISNNGDTIVNSVLSGYGLPNELSKTSEEFDAFDNLDEDYVFLYPKGWVLKPNGQRPGVTAGNFRTADRITVDVFPAKDTLPSWPSKVDADELAQAVGIAIVAPDFATKGDSRQFAPTKYRVEEEVKGDGRTYYNITFTSTTITRSGYDVKKGNLASAVVAGDYVYALNASSRSDLFGKMEPVLAAARASFSLRPNIRGPSKRMGNGGMTDNLDDSEIEQIVGGSKDDECFGITGADGIC